MRTTVTIDDATMRALEDVARRSNKPLDQVVHETLHAGLRAATGSTPKPYRLKPVRLGPVRAGVNLDKALALAERLEDNEANL